MSKNKKPYADDLQPASFRGVPFQVESTDMGAGRRTQVHEYPQRDKPYVEDLGRATRDMGFNAFVIGEDYIAQANKLLSALEEAGPGTLAHPFFGTLTVSLKDSARVSFDVSLGVAKFSLSFVESGELEFPTAAASTQSGTRSAADSLDNAAATDFATRFKTKGFQDFVTSAANGTLTDTLGIISSSQVGKAFTFANDLATSTSTAIALVSDPATLGYKMLGMFGLSGLTTSVAAWSNVVRGLSRMGTSSALEEKATPAYTTPSRQQANTNTAAVNGLCRQLMIAQAVGASSLVGTVADSTPNLSHTDMMAVRDELIAAIDKESLTASDAVYQALMAARAAVWKDLTTRARDSDRLTTLTPAETTPALVLAYDYYEDATRDADIVARNNIARPGFVPPRALKVLTR